jgi:hypothetical protein
MKTKLMYIYLLLAALLLAACAPNTKELSPQAGRFSVKAPVTLVEQLQTIDTGGGKIEAHTYTGEKDGISYVVAYTDFRQEIINQNDPLEMLNTARDTMLSSIKGNLLLETRLTLGDAVGRELILGYTASDGAERVMRARIYLVKNRLYQVIAVADKGQEMADSITKFLDSFKLSGNP